MELQMMDELYDKNVKCPVCSTDYSTKKVRTRALRLIKQDEDFLPYYQGENPIKYRVFVCPNCGYAAYEDKYNAISDQGKEEIKRKISSQWKKRSYGNVRSTDEAIETCKLALYEGQILEESRLYLGTVALNIAWLCRLKGDVDQEKRFLKIAKDFYEEGYYKEDLSNTSMDEIKLGYLIGELYRRLGDADNAAKWFNAVVTSHNSYSNPNIRKMAVEQWRLAKGE